MVPLRMTQEQDMEYRAMVAQNAATMEMAPEVLGAATGLLVNELQRSPAATLKPIMKMLRYVEEVQQSSVHSEDAKFVVYMIGLAINMEKYVIYVLEHSKLSLIHI
eukprot:TRINITY_DN58068_c0_g1_i1.p1 TRINITY_DN58068_c0_g1~~TRINITY_DN58068_c0_g1_i1.p1  ORF type:complete len:106 (+),score=42.36 TRINITY_DN58068_c0_g1_i1:250-567(+)